MAGLRAAVGTVVDGKNLSRAEMATAVDEILDGNADPALISALAVALRMKGETAEELAGAASAMRAKCVRIELALPMVADTCGTGGDGLGTFNVSTASAFVVAACGVPVAKHGNRAVSSRAGSADVLEALGLDLQVPPERIVQSVQRLGLGFLFAPQHHQALRHAAPVRKALGIRTFFNLVGPLSNPAGATHQLVGVYDPTKLELMAAVLGALDVKAAWVVHGAGGLDEISPLGETQVAELRDGSVRHFTVAPADFGFEVGGAESLEGGDARQNADTMLKILSGERDPRRPVVVMNAAAVLRVCGHGETLKDAAKLAESALDSGSALQLLHRLRELVGKKENG